MHFLSRSKQTLQNINTLHQYLKNSTGFLLNKESITNSVFSHTKHLQINNLLIFTMIFHFRHILFLHDLLISFFPFHMSDHHLAKGLSLSSVHDSGIHSLLIPESRNSLIFSTNIPFQAQNTPLQNFVPSLGPFPSPLTLYPDFDSCYTHFMPYRMTPSVRHRVIKVHYYYYYYYYYHPTNHIPTPCPVVLSEPLFCYLHGVCQIFSTEVVDAWRIIRATSISHPSNPLSTASRLFNTNTSADWKIIQMRSERWKGNWMMETRKSENRLRKIFDSRFSTNFQSSPMLKYCIITNTILLKHLSVIWYMDYFIYLFVSSQYKLYSIVS